MEFGSGNARDAVTAEGIRLGLLPEYRGICIVSEDLVESTNDYAKRLAAAGAAHGTLMTAEGQTAGRGRNNREFYSPHGVGLYMSVILRPARKASETPLVTIVAALSVCRAIRGLTGLSPGIKWVNDILLDGRKVCGILAESVANPVDAAGAADEHIIVGIGVNVSARIADFPEPIRETAGSLFPDGISGISRSMLAAAITNNLLTLIDECAVDDAKILDEYRALSVAIGNEIEYSDGEGRATGVALGIASDGGLVVRRNADSAIVTLNSGEVSVKIKRGKDMAQPGNTPSR